VVLIMSNPEVGGIRTRATRRCGPRITTSPLSVRASAGGWLLTKKSKVNSCSVCQIARPLAYDPASSVGSACGSNSIRGCPGGSLTDGTLLGLGGKQWLSLPGDIQVGPELLAQCVVRVLDLFESDRVVGEQGLHRVIPPGQVAAVAPLALDQGTDLRVCSCGAEHVEQHAHEVVVGLEQVVGEQHLVGV